MCAMKINEFENFNKNNVRFCHGCLSTDRALSVLNDLVDIFLKTCVDPKKMPTFQIPLCWECIAMLKKVQLFKMRFDEAQRILNMNLNNIDNVKLDSLSSLTISTQNQKIEVTHNDLVLVEVKTEIDADVSDDESDFLVIDEDKQTEQIKEEANVKEEKKNIKEEKGETVKEEVDEKFSSMKKNHVRRKYFRSFYFLKKYELIRKVRIDSEEIKSWVEKDRESGVFQGFKYKCVKCVYGWNDEDKFAEHNKKYHNETPEPYMCDLCASSLRSKSSLRAHINAHRTLQECTVCLFRCYSKSLIYAHMKRHSRAVKCLICGALMKNMMCFYKHYNDKHKTFLCDHCGKCCKTKYMLEKHIRRYHLGKYPCTNCHMSFKTAKTLKRHIWLKHLISSAENAYCAPCDLQFETTALYRRHVQTSVAHAAERQSRNKKQVPCPECSNVYSRKSYMMNHYRYVHEKQWKYYCTLCDRPFLNRTRYTEHTKFKHEGVIREKDKLCSICGRGFAATKTLMNHMRTHSGERPFECTNCGTGFSRRNALIAHVKDCKGPNENEGNGPATNGE